MFEVGGSVARPVPSENFGPTSKMLDGLETESGKNFLMDPEQGSGG
jgi:hypothetical protein